MGCLGVTTTCSNTCETKIITCVGDSPDNGKYSQCISDSSPSIYPTGCSPTLKMLQSSEQPIIQTSLKDTFGKKYVVSSINSPPSGSLCSVTSQTNSDNSNIMSSKSSTLDSENSNIITSESSTIDSDDNNIISSESN